MAAAKQRSLGARAVVRRGRRENHVAHAEPAEPGTVRPRPEAPVEDRVLGEVVLPVPPADDWDLGRGQVFRRPVPGRVDGLHAKGRRQMSMQEDDGRLPVLPLRRGIVVRPREAVRERPSVPGDG